MSNSENFLIFLNFFFEKSNKINNNNNINNNNKIIKINFFFGRQKKNFLEFFLFLFF